MVLFVVLPKDFNFLFSFLHASELKFPAEYGKNESHHHMIELHRMPDLHRCHTPGDERRSGIELQINTVESVDGRMAVRFSFFRVNRNRAAVMLEQRRIFQFRRNPVDRNNFCRIRFERIPDVHRRRIADFELADFTVVGIGVLFS